MYAAKSNLRGSQIIVGEQGPPGPPGPPGATGATGTFTTGQVTTTYWDFSGHRPAPGASAGNPGDLWFNGASSDQLAGNILTGPAVIELWIRTATLQTSGTYWILWFTTNTTGSSWSGGDGSGSGGGGG